MPNFLNFGVELYKADSLSDILALYISGNRQVIVVSGYLIIRNTTGEVVFTFVAFRVLLK